VDQVTFIYRYGIYTLQRQIGVRSKRGFTEPDDIEQEGPPTHDCLDGFKEKQIVGGRKTITLIVPPLADAMDRRFLCDFIIASDQTIMYTLGPTNRYVSQVIPHDPRLISEWFDSCERCRRFTMVLDDTHIYHAWEDGFISEEDLYFKNNVEIDPNATPDAPFVLTTNGNLPLMENGLPWPSFNDVLYDHLIFVVAGGPAGDICSASYGYSSAVVGGNMAISVAVGSGYQLSASGKLRANIAIYPRLKTA
jgi:hypothetical protein